MVACLLMAAGCKDKSGTKSADPAPGESSPDKNNPPETSPTGPPDFTMAPNELVDEFKRDRRAAEEKYSGKVVEVAGKISFVGQYWETERKRTLGVVTDDLNADALYCDVVQPERAPGKFTLGQSIRIKGVVGKARGSLGVTRCQVVELGPSLLLKVSAEDLGKEYAANAKEAAKKYQRRTILLTGTVTGRPPQQFDSKKKMIILKTVPGLQIQSATTLTPDPLSEKVKPGDVVTMTGYVSTFNAFEKRIEIQGYEVVPK
jgi:hypothetical protein